MSEKIREVKSLVISVLLSGFVLSSGCWSQDAQLSNRALREIGLDSTQLLSTQVLWNDIGKNSITEVKTEYSSYLVTVRTRVHRDYLSGPVEGTLIVTETIEEINGPWDDNLSELHAGSQTST